MGEGIDRDWQPAKFNAEKSQAANILLVLLLGPLGLFYASVTSAITVIILLLLGLFITIGETSNLYEFFSYSLIIIPLVYLFCL